MKGIFHLFDTSRKFYVPFVHKVSKFRAKYPGQLWWRLKFKGPVSTGWVKLNAQIAGKGIKTIYTGIYRYVYVRMWSNNGLTYLIDCNQAAQI